jgi:hypothetical protein
MSAKIITFLNQIESGRIDQMRFKLYCEIKQYNSISTKTLRDRFGSHQSVTATLSSLESDGLIRKSGIIAIDNSVFSQWVAHTDIDSILWHQKEMQRKKKIDWIKRASKNKWIDDQVASFLQNYLQL